MIRALRAFSSSDFAVAAGYCHVPLLRSASSGKHVWGTITGCTEPYLYAFKYGQCSPLLIPHGGPVCFANATALTPLPTREHAAAVCHTVALTMFWHIKGNYTRMPCGSWQMALLRGTGDSVTPVALNLPS